MATTAASLDRAAHVPVLGARGPRERSPSPSSPPLISPGALPPEDDSKVEVSQIEASDFTGVTFSPELWMQRRHWALDVLRKENVRSVMDIGCGPGSLLQTLVMPPSTIAEKPIRGDDGSIPDGKELFIRRLVGVDIDPAVMTSALQTLAPAPRIEKSPIRNPSPSIPRWEPLDTELWLGNIELYNSRLEGYEAIVALEVIEHLEPNLLSRFGVVTMGTYRPKLLLVSTPNFDFNSKFPNHHDEHHHGCGKRGFVDPTGRTDRVFRHSDHKCEMTADEFRHWAESAAADWGYTVEVGGVGISNKPSFYPAKRGEKPKPIYATQTAIFRLATGVPMRSPRSVRTVDLPFMLGASESTHPHRLAAKSRHLPSIFPAPGAPMSPEEVSEGVRMAFTSVSVDCLSLPELWGMGNIAPMCCGSKRYLVACLGGWGDCPSVHEGAGFKVFEKDNGLWVERM
ncbi:hypothetical protein CspeluHIS016_0504910 [Cutaneotrichosporon spelunceum]|uniref:Small RNA 2'-O-methyltransferase n=1 Tax=Cutaneotrichosporon spelunceum TaxID=1672016 RepID=A0AAD3TXS9_9TREE|nr:hypothetical protein CspeluHIS016_0504910 [Cutaneotrichosporon spelunceum]